MPQDFGSGDSYYASTLSQAAVYAQQNLPTWSAWLNEMQSNGRLQQYSPSRLPACAFHVHVRTACCSRTLEGWNMPANREDEWRYVQGRRRYAEEVPASKASTWLAEMQTRKTLRENLSVPSLLVTEYAVEQASSRNGGSSSRSVSPLLPLRGSPGLARMQTSLALQHNTQVSLSAAGVSVDLDISDSSSLPVMPADLSQIAPPIWTPSLCENEMLEHDIPFEQAD